MMRKNILSMFSSLLLLGFVASASAQQLPDFTDLVEKQGPSVVNISTTTRVTTKAPQGMPNIPEDDPLYDFFRRFLPQQPGAGPREFDSQSLGSGFIISGDGYILTNAHVVQKADEITVKLTDGREFKAKQIGSDTRTDVALIKIEATSLPKVVMGDPTKMKVGEWVVAIGSPFGFESSVTAGIVSAKGRNLQEALVPFIQTDVAVNPGNSGGPLFNMRGEVVGINSQIFSRTGGFMGLSFAIPIDLAMSVADQLRTTGKVTRGWLGVVIQPVTKELAESFNLSKAEGALVASVEKGSPADKAGVEAGDVIMSVNGKPVATSADLPRHIAGIRPGAKAVLDVSRKGAVKQLTVTVGELPAERMQGKPQQRLKADEPATPNKFGLVLSDLTPEQRKEVGDGRGILVEDAQGAAARAGIQRGDIVLAVNNNDVKSVQDFNQVAGKLDPKRSIALLVKRGDRTIYVAIKAGEK
ncbi:MAG TPA: DegQ family serine endoprotease [Burkholderiales bacterium]|nr:DegQ family serine endoprotease [Burkholderiales bacterium]